MSQKGFTLIELLVVIAIIGILASVVLASLSDARVTAQDAYRKQALNQVKTALELYHNANGSYPSTASTWYGMSANGGSRTNSGANQYIPGLSPRYMPVLPVDPTSDHSGWGGFLYVSDGRSYKLLIHSPGPERYPAAGEAFHDPVRPTWAWMICVGQPACSY